MDEVRDYFFVRPQDNLLILRPNKVMHLNETGTVMLRMLLDGSRAEEVRDHFVSNFEADGQQVLNDLFAFADDLRSMVTGNQNIYSYKTARIVPFGEGEIKYPVLSEIALTYRCNNECQFWEESQPYVRTYSS
ncbi:MAG: PqqD family peptide modification chaperone [Candidatus Thorarchaeota archaeon]